MNIQTLAENLRNTIAGKALLLDEYRVKKYARGVSNVEQIAAIYATEFLEMNIEELNHILQNVEQCIGVEE